MAQETACQPAPSSTEDSVAQKEMQNVDGTVEYRQYKDESELPLVMNLIDKELSEPYSIFTYRYFIHQWPQLCYLAFVEGQPVGTIVCKIDDHKSGTLRGYIAMLVVIKPMRGRGIATELVSRCIEVMQSSGCREATLEAEVTNKGALALYGNLGFLRTKRLHRYYLNGVDAFRLKLRFPQPEDQLAEDDLDFAPSDLKPSHGQAGLQSHGHERGHHVHSSNCSPSHHHSHQSSHHHHVHSSSSKH